MTLKNLKIGESITVLANTKEVVTADTVGYFGKFLANKTNLLLLKNDVLFDSSNLGPIFRVQLKGNCYYEIIICVKTYPKVSATITLIYANTPPTKTEERSGVAYTNMSSLVKGIIQIEMGKYPEANKAA